MKAALTGARPFLFNAVVGTAEISASLTASSSRAIVPSVEQKDHPMDTRIDGRNGIPMLNLLATLLTLAALLIAAHNHLLPTVSVMDQNFGFLPGWTRGSSAIIALSAGGVFIWYVSSRFTPRGSMCDWYITAAFTLSIVTLFGALVVLASKYILPN